MRAARSVRIGNGNGPPAFALVTSLGSFILRVDAGKLEEPRTRRRKGKGPLQPPRSLFLPNLRVSTQQRQEGDRHPSWRTKVPKGATTEARLECSRGVSERVAGRYRSSTRLKTTQPNSLTPCCSLPQTNHVCTFN